MDLRDGGGVRPGGGESLLGRVITAVPVPLSVVAAAVLAVGLPFRPDPVVLVAKILAILAGAGVVLATAEALVWRVHARLGGAGPRWYLVAAALAAGTGALGLAHAVLPGVDGAAGQVARGLVLVAATLSAAHGGIVLAGLAARPAVEVQGWRARPVQSAVLRGATLLFPIAASFSVAVILDRTLPPPPPSTPALVARIVLVLFCSYVTLFLTERLVRRLGPLTMLLKLSLAFPGGTPSRFAIARRSRNPHALREQLERARRGDDAEQARAAETVLALATALTAHDSRTRGHSERVRVFTDMLADELRLPRGDRDRLRWAALMHDVGKLTVSPRILNKAGPLDRTQWRVMQRHPEEGARIVEPLASWLGEYATAIAQHHERFDGSGYPAGVAGEDIAFPARIITVADAYDTMTAARPYKAAMTPVAAREECERCAGTHFDPMVVRALLNISIRRLWWRMGVASWLAQLPLLGRVPQAVAPVGELASTGVRTAAAVAGVAAATALPAVAREAPSAPARGGIVSVQTAMTHHPGGDGERRGESQTARPPSDGDERGSGRPDDGGSPGTGGSTTGGSTGGSSTGGEGTGGGSSTGGGSTTGGSTGGSTTGGSTTGGGSTGGSTDGGTTGGTGPAPQDDTSSSSGDGGATPSGGGKPGKGPKPGTGPPPGVNPPGLGGQPPPGLSGGTPPGHLPGGPGKRQGKAVVEG